MIKELQQTIILKEQYASEITMIPEGANLQAEATIQGRYSTKNIPITAAKIWYREARNKGYAELGGPHGRTGLKLEGEEVRIILPDSQIKLATPFQLDRITKRREGNTWYENQYQLIAGNIGILRRQELVDDEYKAILTKWTTDLTTEKLQQLIQTGEVISETTVTKESQDQDDREYVHRVKVMIGKDLGLEMRLE